MPDTLPESATGRKPAGPRTPTRDSHGTNLWRILGNSKFFTDAHIITNAPLDPQGMIEVGRERLNATTSEPFPSVDVQPEGAK